MSYFPEIAKDGLRFVISQISDSRKELEIRLVSNNINQNEEFIFVLQNDEITRTDFYTSLRGILDVNINSNVSDVVIPVNNGEYIPLVNFNYYLDPVLPFSDVKKHQFVIKTNKPLPPSFKKLSEIKLLLLKSEIVSNEIMYGGALEEKPQQFGYPLDIDFSQKPFENNIKETSGYESLAEITSSVPEYRLESISSGSSVHKKRLVDYSRFENFIFFSSAEKRLVNFKDKLIKIENQLSNISQSLYAKNQNESNFNNPVRTIRNESFTEINKIVNTFTDYENWLYYDMQRTTSGSAPGLGENYTNSAEALNISSNISQQFNKEGLDIVYVLSGSSEEKINILNEKYKLDDIKFNNTTGSLYLSFLLRASSSVSTNLNHKNTLTSSTPFYPMDALNLQNIAKPSSTGSQYRRYIFAASGSHWRPKQNITIGLNQVNFGKDSSDIILTSGSSINSGTITAVSDYAQYTTYNTSSGVTISGSFVPRGDLFNLSIDATGDTNLNGIITDVKVTTQNPIDVQPFHHLYSTNSGTFTNWYNGIISEASFYDSQNIQRLINNLPSAFLDDAITNAELLQWVDTIGEFFDEYKTLIDDYYKLFNKGYSGYEQVPTKYNKLLAENLGLNILPIEENNFLKFFGIGDSFTDVPEYSDKVINNVLNNLSYLYKTKGTRNSILALLNCYGLPSNVLKIKEGNTHLTEYDQSFLSNDTDKSSVNIFDLSGSISFESKTNNFISLIVGDEFDNTNFKVPWNPSNEITQSSIEGVFKMPNTANTMSLFSSYANNDSSLLWQVNMVPSGSNTTRGKFQFRISSETHGSSDLVGNSVITETDYLNTLDNSLINILVQKSSSGHEISDIHTYELSVGKLTPNDGTILFLTSSKVAVDGDSDSTTNKNFISGSQGKHLFISNNFTGSVAQIKSYSTPLSMTAFKQHIYNKKSVVGTHFTSSLTNLQFHYPLNENLKSGSNKFTIKDISTLSKGGDIDLDSNLFESKSNHYDTTIITDYSFPIFGDGSGQSQHSDNLITIDDEQKLISNLSPNRSVLRYNSNDYRGDYNEIQTDSNHSRNLYFSRSPQEIINDFLKDNLGNLDFNDLFADPRDDFKTTYPDLDNFNKDLQSYDISVDLTRFINATKKIFNNSFLESIKKLIPAKAKINVGNTLKPTYTTRTKLPPLQERPSVQLQTQPEGTKSDLEAGAPNLKDSELFIPPEDTLTGFQTITSSLGRFEESTFGFTGDDNEYNLNDKFFESDISQFPQKFWGSSSSDLHFKSEYFAGIHNDYNTYYYNHQAVFTALTDPQRVIHTTSSFSKRSNTNYQTSSTFVNTMRIQTSEVMPKRFLGVTQQLFSTSSTEEPFGKVIDSDTRVPINHINNLSTPDYYNYAGTQLGPSRAFSTINYQQYMGNQLWTGNQPFNPFGFGPSNTQEWEDLSTSSFYRVEIGPSNQNRLRIVKDDKYQQGNDVAT